MDTAASRGRVVDPDPDLDSETDPQTGSAPETAGGSGASRSTGLRVEVEAMPDGRTIRFYARAPASPIGVLPATPGHGTDQRSRAAEPR